MPRDRDLKRIIRRRMEKTGEAYTTARAHIIEPTEAGTPTDADSDDAASAPTVAEADAPSQLSRNAAHDALPQDYAAVAGMRDEAIEAKTGRGWTDWVRILDAVDAHTLTHTEIARIVSETHGVPDWWTQAVAVGYERIRGLRERGQRRSGHYEISRSRTIGVAVETLFDACADDATRARWLSGAAPVVRTATKPKSIRLGWEDGTIAALWFTAKGPTKSTVGVQHTKLPDRETGERLKQFWGEKFDALADLLTRS